METYVVDKNKQAKTPASAIYNAAIASDFLLSGNMFCLLMSYH